ncbi:MAG: translocation and assembly module protein TamB, partial [Ruegeria sp.]
MRYILILVILVMWPLGVLAQDAESEDRGFLVGLLESSLGGDGRTVRIDGFAGALSSRATIERITIADPQGVWLTLEDVAMQWNRSALLRAAIDIEELHAARVELSRLPAAVPNDLPAPEAEPFSLPDSPASISISTLQIDTVALSDPVLGEALSLTVDGSATLADGAGETNVTARRTDGPEARFAVQGSYANDSRALTIDLSLTEAASGLVSGLLKIPDTPRIDLRIAGDGALNAFAAPLDLRTDDTPRLAGGLTLQSEADGPMAFDAALRGDVTALVLPESRAFFGP